MRLTLSSHDFNFISGLLFTEYILRRLVALFEQFSPKKEKQSNQKRHPPSLLQQLLISLLLTKLGHPQQMTKETMRENNLPDERLTSLGQTRATEGNPQ